MSRLLIKTVKIKTLMLTLRGCTYSNKLSNVGDKGFIKHAPFHEQSPIQFQQFQQFQISILIKPNNTELNSSLGFKVQLLH